LDNFHVAKTKQIILQSTPLCNLNCSYCYLPEQSRASNVQMDVETAIHAVDILVKSGYLADEVEIRWHAGEPLIVPPSFYSEVVKGLRRVVPKHIGIKHSVQTNGTLITDEWCKLFLQHDFRVGVSIDGPKIIHDRNRLTKGGKGTFDKVMRGIDKLREHRVPFEVIAVVTRATLQLVDQFYKFFKDLNPTIVALNIEESECGYDSDLLLQKDFIVKYKSFFSRIHKLQIKGKLRFREIDEIQRVIMYNQGDRYNLQSQPFAIVTIDWAGNFYTYSPELAGMNHKDYPSFSIGNVMRDDLADILNSAILKKLTADIFAGVELCRGNCEYFSLCGGGAPANKLYENGTFISTDTGYCKARIQIPTDIVLADLETKSLENNA
jgi:uncharacterized protein